MMTEVKELVVREESFKVQGMYGDTSHKDGRTPVYSVVLRQTEDPAINRVMTPSGVSTDAVYVKVESGVFPLLKVGDEFFLKLVKKRPAGGLASEATNTALEALDFPTLVRLFNEWMRRFIDEPEKFEREFEAVKTFLEQEQNGFPVTYGQSCAAYLFSLAAGDFLPVVKNPPAGQPVTAA